MKFSAFVFTAAMLISTAGFAQTGKTEGEVRKVDTEQKKITLRHGPITGPLEMPAMTMVFQLKDDHLLHHLRVGDTVEARVLKENDVFYIQSAEKK